MNNGEQYRARQTVQARTRVEQYRFGGVAGGLAGAGNTEEVPHQPPEGGAVGVALREVERSWSCATRIKAADRCETVHR